MSSNKNVIFFIVIIFSICSLVWSEVDMVLIKGGSFIRKNPSGGTQKVTLSPFYMSKYEIMVQEWCMYLESKGADSEDWTNLLLYTIDDWSIKTVNPRWPAFELSWIEAVEYCNWLSIQDGYEPCYVISEDSATEYKVSLNTDADGYRLPTVAEWQMVSDIRVVELRQEDVLLQSVLAENNSSRLPSEVGSHRPNRFGLYDILGGIEEFCWDYYNPNMQCTEDVINPLGPTSFLPDEDEIFFKELLHETRVAAGGMWGTKVQYLLDNPFRSVVSIEKGFVGIRLVRSVKE